MKRLLSALTGLALVPVVLSAHADRMVFPTTLLQLNSMVGNSDEYIADTGVTIRGILGGLSRGISRVPWGSLTPPGPCASACRG